MNGEEAIELLKGGQEGIKEWNRRKGEGEEIPDLSETDLADTTLCWPEAELFVDLNGTHLENANLRFAHLEKADLKFAHLFEAHLSEAHLEKADLYDAHLEKASLYEAHLEKADLNEAHLEKANLYEAHLEKANLRFAHLENADLRFADLEKASLIGANLENADLTHARLENADLVLVGIRRGRLPLWVIYMLCRLSKLAWLRLRGRWPFAREWIAIRRVVVWRFVPFKLDSTYIRGAHFSPQVADPWSVLRRTYTGSRQALHLLLLVVFLIPYVARTVFWVGIGRIEEQAVRGAVAAIETTSRSLGNSPDPKSREWAARAEEFLERFGSSQGEKIAASGEELSRRIVEARGLLSQAADLVESEDFQNQERIDQARQLLALVRTPEFQERSVWQLVLGLDKGYWYFSLVAILLIYNGGRGVLTLAVGRLRDEEDRSGISPAWTSYRRPFVGHLAVAMLWYLALLSFAWNLWHWMTMKVFLPAAW